jgi:hypothetical protein
MSSHRSELGLCRVDMLGALVRSASDGSGVKIASVWDGIDRRLALGHPGVACENAIESDRSAAGSARSTNRPVAFCSRRRVFLPGRRCQEGNEGERRVGPRGVEGRARVTRRVHPIMVSSCGPCRGRSPEGRGGTSAHTGMAGRRLPAGLGGDLLGWCEVPGLPARGGPSTERAARAQWQVATSGRRLPP